MMPKRMTGTLAASVALISRRALLTALAVLSTLSCRVYAVDGIVLINQANASAGNVTPGDTPGFPVTISAPGSYKLSSNLVMPDANTTAIEITTNNVSIDLNGFSILGPTTCSGGPPVTSCSPAGTGNGIASNHSSIAVVNGNIRGMGADGIHLDGGSNNRIEKVQAISNGGVGIFLGGGQDTVSSCHGSLNGATGISGRGLARSNIAEGNGGVGLSVENAIDNIARSNHGNGLDAFGVITGNSAFENTGAGVSASCPSTVIGNYAVGNLGGNIVRAPPSGCVLANNVAP
jgi:parallel beta-helix repeat protein